MDENELNIFREGWKEEIKKKQQVVSHESDKPGDLFGKADDIYKNETASSQDFSNTFAFEACNTASIPQIRTPHNEPKSHKSQFVGSKKQKQSATYSLLTLDIPSYQQSNFANKNRKLPVPPDNMPKVPNNCDSNQDFISLLIRDIDEITTVPFFDVSLPKEVCVKVFAHLDVNDLCHCACVSKAWSALANDELIWYNIYKKLGFEQSSQENVLDQDNWKALVKDGVLRQRLIEKNWKEMICQTETLEYEKGVALSACKIYKNLLVAGYANGKTCLWDVESNWRHFLEPSAAAVEDPSRASVECLSVDRVLCASAFLSGMVNVWHTDISIQPIYEYRLPQPANHIILASTKSMNPLLLTSSGPDIRIDQVKDDGQWGIVKSKSFQNQIKFVNLLAADSDIIFAIAMKEDVVMYKPKTDSAVDLDKIAGTKITAMTTGNDHIAVGWAPFGFGAGSEFTTKVRLYDKNGLKHIQTFLGHYGEITCLDLSYNEALVTGSKDKRVRIYDFRTEQPQLCLRGQTSPITTVQMDCWKVVSGSLNGTIKVWDIRMERALWETSGHHPVRLCQFDCNRLVTANIPVDKVPRESMWYADDLILHRRHRGSVKVYDFSGSCGSDIVPEEMRSSYDDTAGYNYNINLVAPYDALTSEIN